jgi:hypothetical protein
MRRGVIMESEGTGRERQTESIDAKTKDITIPKSIKLMKTRAGLDLCKITIISLVILELVVVVVYLLITLLPLRSLNQPLDQESIKTYGELRSAMAGDVLKIGEQFLGKLLPIITLLLGYMFGSREEKVEVEEPQEGD